MIHRVGMLDAESGPGEWKENEPGDTCMTVLVAHSRRTVCRELDVPVLSDEETRGMLELRLEAELPYGVSEAMWAWMRLDESTREGSAPVLCLEMPAEDVSGPEKELAAAGRAPEFVDCREAALAHLALTGRSDDTVAVAAIEEGRATVVVVRHGKLHYARTLAHAPGDADRDDAGLRSLAREINQTLQHYALTRDVAGPQQVLLTGNGKNIEVVEQALADTAGLSVRAAALPDNMKIHDERAEPDKIAAEFGSCLGAFLAAHRRVTGGKVAAPSLRSRAAQPRKRMVSGRVALIGLTVLLIVGCVWAAFGARKARLRAAERAVENSGSLLRRIEVLEEETEILQRENQQKIMVLDSLRAMSEALPKGIDISDLTIDANGSVTLVGRAQSIEVASRGATALSDSKEFAGARLERTSTDKGKVTFRITCKVAGRGG